MTLEIVSSNRLETLGEIFASRLRDAPLPPLVMEQVLVQSRGMARWLNLKLAAENGIAAGIEYLFPNNFVDRLLEKLVPDAVLSVGGRRAIGWMLAGILGREGIDPGVDGYAASSGLHRLQLAFVLADCFDQYTVYRPGMIREWEEGGGDHWQARLWRRLREQWREPHRAALLARLRRDGAGPDLAAAAQIPPRLSVFGISSLPPFHIEVLARLAERTRVTFYLLNPCRHMWSDITGRREKHRLTDAYRIDPAELYLENHNPLLASLGRQGADLFRILADFETGELECFDEPPAEPGDPLALVQHDLLNDVVPGQGPEGEPVAVASEDVRPTITFHDCSSRVREVEVLREELLAIFSAEPDISCGDVVVMVPDIAAYAPLIDAVFGDGREPEIPYAIADRPVLDPRGLAGAFMDILALPRERYRLGAVAAVFEKESVRRRFGLSENDVEQALAWFETAGVRWGLDAGCRELLGAPATGENTWRSGVDRLLAGYAAGGVSGCATIMGIAPLMRLGSEEADLAGRMVTALETIFSLCVEFSEPAGLDEWHDRLVRLAALCLEPGPGEEDELAALQDVMDSLARGHENGFSGAIGLGEVIGYLTRELRRERRSGGFLAGGVTFCELLPMRSIPFAVICLLGMDYEAFPRRDRTGSLDLMARSPRPGDRSRRRDDRYLFLETLVSARRYLYLSYVGRDSSSNAERPPSVLLSELADYLDRRFALRGGEERMSALLTRRHPVAAWSPLNFMPGRGRSFSREDLECARSFGAGRDHGGLYPAAAGEQEDEADMELAVLEDFFANPVRFFCRRVLGVELPPEAAAPDDLEPFDLDPLSRHHVDARILAALAAGTPAAACLARLRSEGALPHGARGDFLFAARLRMMEKVEAARLRLAGGDVVRRPVAVDVAGAALRGEVEVTEGGRVVMARPGRIRSCDYLSLWLRLLAAAACGMAVEGVYVGLEKDEVRVEELACPEDPAAALAGLVAVYREGRSRLLPLFPASSLAFALKDAAGDRAGAFAEARNKFHGGFNHGGDADDPWVAFAFRDSDPLDDSFVSLSRRVFLPLVEAMVK